jgi:hypothetical protein
MAVILLGSAGEAELKAMAVQHLSKEQFEG